MKVRKCRRCRVETGLHNVRTRTKPQYYICKFCEDLEDKLRRIRNRLIALVRYGGVCACCGEATYEFLSFDHINGGGTRHKRQRETKHIEQWLKQNGYPEGFRILCHNCNAARGFYGYCPHGDPGRFTP